MKEEPKKNPRIFLSPPHLGTQEFQFVREAFESNYIAPLGPQVNAFEKEFSELAGVPHAAALSSGTAAIHLALDLLGVGPGDEVFASTLTFLGGVPVFIDADPETWNLSSDLLAQALDTAHKNGRLPKSERPEFPMVSPPNALFPWRLVMKSGSSDKNLDARMAREPAEYFADREYCGD